MIFTESYCCPLVLETYCVSRSLWSPWTKLAPEQVTERTSLNIRVPMLKSVTEVCEALRGPSIRWPGAMQWSGELGLANSKVSGMPDRRGLAPLWVGRCLGRATIPSVEEQKQLCFEGIAMAYCLMTVPRIHWSL